MKIANINNIKVKSKVDIMSAFIFLKGDNQMTADKLKQYIGLFGGMLGALYLALKASGIEVPF